MRILKTALMLCFILTAIFILPPVSYARVQSDDKTVRVGWYGSPYNISDEHGRRSGYAYEYQRRIAAYNGWNYEYVEDSWPNLLQMLINGEIDLLSDVSYTEERTEFMLFPKLPMGAEGYYIFINSNNKNISRDDYSTFNGKKAGVYKGSLQTGLFKKWMEDNGLQMELVELTCSTDEVDGMLTRGDIDIYIGAEQAHDHLKNIVPITSIGASDFFFAVSKSRPDLLDGLNSAMYRILTEEVDYNSQLKKKYTQVINANVFLSSRELSWLASHKVIRIGYQDNHLAFCSCDPNTGKLTGALKDYLRLASVCLENANLNFLPVAFPNATLAMEAMRRGEVDCVFPVNLSYYDAEVERITVSRPLMRSEIYAVVRASDQQSLLRKAHVTVAVKEDDTNYKYFILDNFPNWRIEHYKNSSECLEAVANGEADCVIVNNYRYATIARQCDELKLGHIMTGLSLNYCLAIPEGESELYSIMSRAIALVPDSSISASLAYYASENNPITISQFLRQNRPLTIAVAVAIFAMLVIITIQHRLITVSKEADENRHKVEDLNKQVFVDALTQIRNKRGYDSYIQQLQSFIDRGGIVEMAIGVFDCDNLKKINDRYGHYMGDAYLRASSSLMCNVFKHSPVFRTGGDEFVVVLRGSDYEARDSLIRQFEEEQNRISASAENEWEKVSVSYGVAVYDQLMDISLKSLASRADQLMYENKRKRKEAKQ